MNWRTVLADSRFWLEAVILFTATFTGVFLSFLLERKRLGAQEKETFGKILQSLLLESANNHAILNNIEGTVTVGATPAFEINVSALEAALGDPLFHRWADYSMVKTALVVRTNLGSINNFLSFYRLAAAAARGLTAKGAGDLQIRTKASKTILEILQKQLDETMPKFNAAIVRDSESRNVDESLAAALREEKAKLEELDSRPNS